MNQHLLVITLLLKLVQCWPMEDPQPAIEECRRDGRQCLRENQTVHYKYIYPVFNGEVVCGGFGTQCFDNGMFDSNTVTLVVQDDCSMNFTQECGAFTGTVSPSTCNGTHQVASLSFVADIEFDSFNIKCEVRPGSDPRRKYFETHVGVIPDLPEHANVTFPENTICQYDWDPPVNAPMGGLCGYNLSYGGDCGNCTPIGFVNSSITSSTCTGWEVNGQTCYFEVRSVANNCGFYSDPRNRTSILDNTEPTDVRVQLICFPNLTNPMIHVTWEYFPPELENTTRDTIPGVLGFRLKINDELNNSLSSVFLDDSSFRDFTFETGEITGVNGSIRFISVEVNTVIDNFTNTSELFSIRGIQEVNTSTVLTELVCIEVFINNLCAMDQYAFEAQIFHRSLALGSTCDDSMNATITSTERFPIDADSYGVCIPIPPRSLCFTVAVFTNGSNSTVGQTEEQSIVLQTCNTETLISNDYVVFLDSSGGRIASDAVVPHNTVVVYGCDDNSNYRLNIEHNQTRCVNGTFDPVIEQVSCSYIYLELTVSVIVGVPVLVIAVIVVAVSMYCCCFHKKSKYTLTRRGIRQRDRSARSNEDHHLEKFSKEPMPYQKTKSDEETNPDKEPTS